MKEKLEGKDYRTRRLVTLLMAIVMFFVVVAVVMWIWNRVVPWVIGFPPVTYWQAAGLIIIGRVIFGGLGTFGRRRCCCGRYHGYNREHGDRHSHHHHGHHHHSHHGNHHGYEEEFDRDQERRQRHLDNMTAQERAEYNIRKMAFLEEMDDE